MRICSWRKIEDFRVPTFLIWWNSYPKIIHILLGENMKQTNDGWYVKMTEKKWLEIDTILTESYLDHAHKIWYN